jgi:hypothetical protein
VLGKVRPSRVSDKARIADVAVGGKDRVGVPTKETSADWSRRHGGGIRCLRRILRMVDAATR